MKILPNDNLPLFVEEQIIQQKIKIPTNFVELQIPLRNNWGSTEGLDKTLCERYIFKYNNKSITLDITQELRKKLGLAPNENCSSPIYLNQTLLKKLPDEGGITIDKEQDIICQREGITIIKNEGVQVDFTSGQITELTNQLKATKEFNEETLQVLEKLFKDKDEKQIVIIFLEEQLKQLIQQIKTLRSELEKEALDKRKLQSDCRELERKITKLKEDEQVLLSLQYRITDLQTELRNERLLREGIEQNLQTTHQEMNDRLSVTQERYTNEVLKCLRQTRFLNKENQQLNNTIDLLNQIAEHEITDLQTQINNLTNEVNSLSLRPTQEQLTQAQQERNAWQNNYNQLIRNVSNLLIPEVTTRTIATTDILLLQQIREIITTLLSERQSKEQMAIERNNRPNITQAQYNNLLERPTIEQLNTANNNVTTLQNIERNAQTELGRVRGLLAVWTNQFRHRNASQVSQDLEDERKEKAQRDQTIVNLNNQIASLQSEVSSLRDFRDNGWERMCVLECVNIHTWSSSISMTYVKDFGNNLITLENWAQPKGTLTKEYENRPLLRYALGYFKSKPGSYVNWVEKDNYDVIYRS